MNYQQGGGGQFPQQGPRKLLKLRNFPKDGPAMTSTPYQDYNAPPPAGFSVTPQLNNDWGDPSQNFQSNVYGSYAQPNNFEPQIPNYGNQFMTPQQQMPQMSSYPYGGPPANTFPMGAPGLGYADIINNPLVTNVVKEYGKNFIENAGGDVIGRFSGLKYYFAVDTRYVMRKLKLILFPFIHKDWGVQYEQDKPVQPRYEINAPDLYIPVMAYVTYVLLAGLVLGIQNRFSPEKLGMHASTAVAWTIVEILMELMFLYLTNIQSTLKICDLVSYSGYKYVGIILAILMGQIFQWTGYLVCILYCGAAMAFFNMRSLKFRVMESPTQNVQTDMYGQVQPSSQGTKRRMYFLMFVAISQPVLMTWVSYHLISSHIGKTNTSAPPL